MEAVAPHPGLVVRPGERVEIGELRVGAVEGRVEAGDLRQPRLRLAQRADRGEVVRLVQRGEGDQPLERGEHRLVDQHRPGVLRAAVDHAVADGEQRLAREPPRSQAPAIATASFASRASASRQVALLQRRARRRP